MATFKVLCLKIKMWDDKLNNIYPLIGMKENYMNTMSTETLHKSLKSLAKCHNLIMQGTFPGMAHTDIKDSVEYLLATHDQHLAEFKLRPDCTDFEPNILKVGTAEVVYSDVPSKEV